VIDVPPETQHQPRERDHVAVKNGKRTDDEHPAWCSPAHCFVTDEEVRVHQQAPTHWEDQTAELRCESGLLDPADDEYVYVELSLRDLRLKSVQYYGCLPVDVARRLRDQLTEHLDAAQ
jgi:hypothetical protein